MPRSNFTAKTMRKFFLNSAIAVLTGGTVVGGCTTDIAKEFRAAAVPNLESGVNSIVDGLVSGGFAILDARSPDTSSSTSSSGSGG